MRNRTEAPHPTVEEFRAILVSRQLEAIVREYVFQGPAFVFGDRPSAMALLRQHLRANLTVKEENVVIVGSAKIGFSLNPDNFPRLFSEESDIDVLIVDERLFDRVWLTLLRWQHPRRIMGLDRPYHEWARVRRKEIYWGWFMPDKIRFDGLELPDVLKPLRSDPTAEVGRNAVKYVRAHEKGANDKKRRADRHVVLADLIAKFFRPKKKRT